MRLAPQRAVDPMQLPALSPPENGGISDPEAGAPPRS
jgi:hypothetical protein